MAHNWIRRDYPTEEASATCPDCHRPHCGIEEQDEMCPSLAAAFGIGIGCTSLLATRKAAALVQIGIAATIAAIGIGVAIALSTSERDRGDTEREDAAPSPAQPPVTVSAAQQAPNTPEAVEPPEKPSEQIRSSVYEIRDIFAEKKTGKSKPVEPATSDDGSTGHTSSPAPKSTFSNGKVKSFTAEFMPIVSEKEEAEMDASASLPSELKEALDELAGELEDAINDRAAEELDFDEFAADAVSNTETPVHPASEKVVGERAELIQNYREIFRNRK